MRLGKSPLRNFQNGSVIHKEISIERNGRPFLSMLIFVYCEAVFEPCLIHNTKHLKASFEDASVSG